MSESEKKHFLVQRLDAGDYDTNINETDLVGVNSLGTLASKHKDIVKFVQVHQVSGYYSDVLSYWHVTRKGKCKGLKECATYGEALRLITNIKHVRYTNYGGYREAVRTYCPYVEGQRKVFFVDTAVRYKGARADDFLNIDKKGNFINKDRSFDDLRADDYIGIDDTGKTCSKFSKVNKFVHVDSVNVIKKNSPIILLREVIAKNKE